VAVSKQEGIGLGAGPVGGAADSGGPEDSNLSGILPGGAGPRRTRLASLIGSWVTPIAIVILLVGIAASLFAANAWRNSVQRHDSQEFQSTASDVTAALSSTIQRDLDLTRTVRAIVAREPNIQEAAFESWSSQLRAGHNATNGLLIFYVRPVSLAGLPAYIREVKTEPIFQFSTRGDYRIVPAGRRSRYCLTRDVFATDDARSGLPALIDLCAPLLPGIGFSPFPSLLKSMTDADSMIAVDEAEARSSLVISGLAIYRPGAPVQTVAQRRAASVGWVGSTFDADAEIRSLLLGRRAIAVAVYHRNPGGRPLLLGSVGDIRAGPLSQTHHLAGENTWLVKVSGSAVGPSSLLQGLIVLISMLLLTGLTVVLFLVLTRSRQRALALVLHKTSQLQHQALHDALTGLPNRVLVIDRAEQMLSRAKRIHAPAAALFIDLDDFQQINDRFGHSAGDELLQTIAARLQAVVRGGDTVGRLAGDEFVALVEPGSFEIAPELVAERILEVLRQPITLRNANQAITTITASMGVATAQGLSAETLMREAHVALYRAKQTGRNRYVLFQSAMQATLQGRLLLQTDLREALDRDELFLLYQPTIDLQTEHVIGVEALVRWRHPVRGIVQPNDFIPLAEETGLIIPIGRWVLAQACRQAVIWHKQDHPIQVSVNVSARQLDDENLLEDVRGALIDSGLKPTSLTLEITETALMRDADSTAQQLRKLKALGMRIAIDDFGTGYSSLAYLRQFPVDVLKIDRAFVSGLTDSADSRALAHTLIQLGKTLGLQALAEGIEERAQLEVLKREQCELGQGFLFARPLTVEDFELYLRESHAPPVARAALAGL
jgi:diguanylate cyclase (GGDEF)-like protein